MKRYQLISFLLIAFLIIILRLPSLEEPFDNDSSAIAYSARLITRGEPLYSTHHPGHHLPAAYYTYALIFKLLGDRFFSVKLVLIPWMICTAFLVYWIGYSINNHRSGVIAAVIFSILSSHMYLKGTTAEPEMFALLPITACVLLSICQLHKSSSSWSFLAGVFGGVAFMYKAVFLAPMIVAAGMIILEAWLDHQRPNALHNLIYRLLGLTFGFTVILVIVILYFSSQGLHHRFLLVFSAGRYYINLRNQSPLYLILLIPLISLAINNLYVLLLGLFGSFRMLRYSRQDGERNPVLNIPLFGIVAWFVFSLLTAGSNRVGFPHYALVVIPSLSIVAGWELTKLQSKISYHVKKWQIRFNQIIFVLLLLLIGFNSAWANKNLYIHFIRYHLGEENYSTFLENGTIEGSVYVRNQELADYIIAQTSSEDRIYFWSDFPEIYYLADRRAPIDTIWPTQTELSGSPLLIFNPQTKYIILGSSIYFPKTPTWFLVELEKAYKLEDEIDGQKIYRRVEQ